MVRGRQRSGARAASASTARAARHTDVVVAHMAGAGGGEARSRILHPRRRHEGGEEAPARRRVEPLPGGEGGQVGGCPLPRP